ncbi:MAG: hypothetical protein KDE27_17015 [Planctomycetes bacterium]|nr:hypothetical protein [Planctomycetota bacterium]
MTRAGRRRGLATALGAALLGAACAPAEPAGYDAPVAVLHDPDADVYLVANQNGAATVKNDNGYIARVQPAVAGNGAAGDGMVRRWIAGGSAGVTLHAPKGLALHGDTLWVADIDVVRAFDRAGGRRRGEVAIPGATDLWGCAAAPDGTIYVSDPGLDADLRPTGTDAIWRIRPGGTAAEPLIRGPELGQPTALVARAAGVYVVGHRDGAFYEVDVGGRRTAIAQAPHAALVGLVRTDAAYFATSRAGSCVYRFGRTGGIETLPDRLEQPGACGYDAARGRLLVPLPGRDAVVQVAATAR